jgi:superfamily II DNA or RNA helicase
MQISSPRGDDRRSGRPGDLVLVRRARWRIVHVRAYEDCDMVTLCGLAPPQLGLERHLLVPFDRLEPIAHPTRPRVVHTSTWSRACRALIAADGPPGSLRAARSARIDLLPHQLEPAMAILRGLGTRILLADEVGLGKTIQAGLIASELLARGLIERVLVLTPPGLRDQWLEELGDRFAIDATGVDGHVLRRLAATLPVGVNPWRMLTTAVVSIDYVKRLEVLPAAASRRWDLVILDEAHACGGDSDRRAAAHALAASASYVLLLSATPHNGDRELFAALCGVGAAAVRPISIPEDYDCPPRPSAQSGRARAADHAAPLLVFRRTRADAGIGSPRRVHILRVRQSSREARMHALLARYRDAVRAEGGHRGADAWLALSVLHKRALSGAWSLACTVERQLAALSAEGRTGGGQMALPLGDPQGELIGTDEAPSWPADLRLSDPVRERRLLSALHQCARSAAAGETKIAALVTLLRRARQPAVVFTEYRDTLQHVRQSLSRPALVLHGGLTRDERSSVLASFARDPRGLLLATDAAAEGLNLHHHCRLVINLELPWNPMRLEQRIGRVDRIGQRRTVHAFHLIASGTGETRLLARLRARVASAQADIGAPDPLDDERRIARLVMEP